MELRCIKVTITGGGEKLLVIDVQDPKKEDESQKQESLEESEEPKPKGNKEEKRSRKQRSQGESGDPNPK